MAFRFKQFQILDNKCAMKVGVDAVLLGAWTDVSDAKSILDIGTGSGVIALMLAQRSEAFIHGIEIDIDAAKQAEENVRHSPWSDRVKTEHISVQDFASSDDLRFDLLVCNPPYFNNSLLSPSSGRNQARHTGELSFNDLADAFSKLTAPGGKCCVILPLPESSLFESVMRHRDFAPSRKLLIYPKPGKPANRILMQFEFGSIEQAEEESIYIRSDENSYTDAYKELTKDFYLAF
jgi:tRNA1Val (adenine37-N6)-methyltransferase